MALTALQRIPAKTFIKFASVKASGAVINFSLLYILTDIIGFWYIVSAIIVTLLVTTYNYLLNNAWTFRDKRHTKFARVTRGIRYALTSWAVLPIYMGLLYLLTDIYNIWYMLSALLSGFITVVIRYTIALKFVWNKDNLSISPETKE